MTKTELIEKIAISAGLSKNEAAKALNAALDNIIKALQKGQKVTLIGFGTFHVASRKSRSGRNPRTGESIIIPATKVPKFIPGKAFKKALK